MTAIQKKKLCWNCEGSVSVEEETCPYCGVSVIPASLDGPTAYHSPPYQINSTKEQAVHYPPYAAAKEAVEPSSLNQNEEEASEDEEDTNVPVDEFKNILLSMLLMLAGSMFFLFGLTLFLFSHNGLFTLQWDSSYWFVYSLISLPLLLFGWRALLRLDEET